MLEHSENRAANRMQPRNFRNANTTPSSRPRALYSGPIQLPAAMGLPTIGYDAWTSGDAP